MKIHDLPLEERPREKALEHGLESLSDAELLGLIIARGTRGHSALEIAKELLAIYQNFQGLAIANPDAFSELKGLSKIKALELGAVFELSRRRESESVPEDSYEPSDLFERLVGVLGQSKQEKLLLLLYSRQGHLLKEKTLFVGTEDSLSASKKLILGEAVAAGASSFVIVHNHPSGDPLPSPGELVSTSALQSTALSLGLRLLDHLIISEGAFYSFSENGIL